jgi:hypothetical protein
MHGSERKSEMQQGPAGRADVAGEDGSFRLCLVQTWRPLVINEVLLVNRAGRMRKMQNGTSHTK